MSVGAASGTWQAIALRARQRAANPAWRSDPVFGQLHALAVNAEAMTPDLWDHLRRDFYGHEEERPASRARERRNRPAPRILA